MLLECCQAPCACIVSDPALQFLSGHVGAAESVWLENPKILTLWLLQFSNWLCTVCFIYQQIRKMNSQKGDFIEIVNGSNIWKTRESAYSNFITRTTQDTFIKLLTLMLKKKKIIWPFLSKRLMYFEAIPQNTVLPSVKINTKNQGKMLSSWAFWQDPCEPISTTPWEHTHEHWSSVSQALSPGDC